MPNDRPNAFHVNRRDLLRGGSAALGVAALAAACKPAPGTSTSGSSPTPAPSTAEVTPAGKSDTKPAGKKSGGSKGGPKTGTVGYWDWWVSQSPWVKNEMSLFQKANPGVTIKRTVQQSGTYAKLFALAERGKNVPDVFMINTTTQQLNEQVANGWLRPLNDFADSKWIHQFPPYTFAEGGNMVDGKIYSAPLTAPSASPQLYINTKVFKDAGLVNSDGSVKVPKTWDDMTHAAETINQKSNGSVYGLGFGNSSFDILGWWCDVMVRAAGSPGGSNGQDLRTGKYVFGGDRNYTDWISLMLEWKSKGYFYPSSLSISDEIARAYFERGRFGMTVGGVWNEPEWTEHKFTDYTLTTLVGPDPKPKGYFYSTPGGTLIGISPSSKVPELAWEWLKWVYSPAAGKRWTQDYNEDLSVYPQNNDPAKIKFKPFADFVALAKDCIPGPSASLRNSAISQVVIEAITPNFAAVLTGLYSGQVKDAGTAFKSVDERSEQALEKGLAQAKKKGLKVSLKDYVFPDWDITKPYKYDIPKYPS